MSLSPARTIDVARSRLTMAFANWRSGATTSERRAYNQTDQVLLTFDDFAKPETIDQFLLILADKRVSAAFFVLGSWANENSASIEKIRASGHFIGNHTATHQRLRTLNDAAVIDEINNGVPSTLLRPPFGDCDDRIRTLAKNLGYKLALWTIDSEDWKNLPASMIADRVIRELHPGACILMHLEGKHTLEALPSIIDAIRADGYTLWSGGIID